MEDRVIMYNLIKKINNWLPKFKFSDKLYHYIVGAVSSSFMLLPMLFLDGPLWVKCIVTLLPAILIGAYKEYEDYKRYRFLTPENGFDFIITVMGGVTVVVLAYLI